MKSLSLLTIVYIFVMVALLMTLAHVILDDDRALTSVKDSLVLLGYKQVFLLLSAAGLFLIEMLGAGAASFDDMQQDVLDALAWLHANESRLFDLDNRCGSSTQLLTPQNNATTCRRRPFIFGGYSSGGHVAASVVQNSTMWTDRNLPEPHVHCDSMLYISPVLSTKPYHDELPPYLKQISSLSSSSLSSLPIDATSTSVADQQLLQPLNEAVRPILSSKSPPPPLPPPTWLTDQVVKAVFGHHIAHTIPSPLHTHDKSPPIPHTFLGCKHEMFGLNWLDTFFSSPKFSELLNRMGIASRFVPIESDHWNILSSTELRDVLRIELKRIEQECLKSKGWY